MPEVDAEYVLVQGRGGQGRDVLDAMQVVGMRVRGVLDDQPPGTNVLGVPVLGPPESWRDQADAIFVLSHGPAERRAMAAELRAAGVRIGSIVHPRASVSPHAALGEGAIILANASVAPDARVGELSIINSNCSIDHDCVLGAAVQFGPGVTLAGVVTVEDEAFLGVGVTVMPGVRIGARAVVGAGAVVIREVPAGATVVGNPAKPRM